MKALLLVYYNSKFRRQRQRKPTVKTQQKFKNFFVAFLQLCLWLHPSVLRMPKSSVHEVFS